MYMRQVAYKLLEFNVFDDINNKSENFNKYRDNREFMVQMFGLNEKGETASIFVEGFSPFFYVKVDDTMDEAKLNCFISELKTKIGPYFEESIIKSKLIKKKKLYGFDEGKLHNFVVIVFKNTMALNKAKKLWYNEIITPHSYEKKLKPDGYIFEDSHLYLYEGNIPPLLRLFHIKEISPSGWIALPENSYLKHKTKTTYCDYEYTINYDDIKPLDINKLVPYKQCSFDIEASSSHGDFPVPIKNYKKLAIDIVNILNKHDQEQYPHETQEESYRDLCNLAILTAFQYRNYPEINRVYTKNSITEERVLELINEWIDVIPASIKTDKNEEETIVDEASSDEEDDIANTDNNNNDEVEEKPKYFKRRKPKKYNSKTATIMDILNDNNCEYNTKVNELCKSLTHIFPPLEGDKVTFIGSYFKKYGESKSYLEHCIVLNGCKVPETMKNAVIETYDTEREVLLAWTRLIQKENPDIISGYNINTFDFDFMDKRSQELKCRYDFLKLSRNKDEQCLNRNWKTGEENIETNKIILASGEYNLKYIKMTGRLIIDLYIYFRREYQFSSYKLDAVSSQLIGDNVKSIKHIKQDGEWKTAIISKNLKGIGVGDYVNFEEISYSSEYYKKGKKFEIQEIDKENNNFIINGKEELDMTKKVKWGIAKDDVSPQDIFRLTNGSDEDRGIVAKYCIKDCKLVQDIIDKIDLLTGFIEMASYCSVPMMFLVFRGQGIKLLSYVAKKCREKNTLMPTLEKMENDGGYEGAIVLEPKCDIYLDDPVACVDYSSLYPSSMISENISHDSKVWTKEYNLDGELIEEKGEKDDKGNFIYDNLDGYKYVDVTYDTYHYIRKTPKAAETKEKCGYKICRYAQLPEGKSIMPSILEELLGARKTTKKLMSKAYEEGDTFMGNIYEKRQLTIKVTANSLYGQCGARTSAFYDKDVAAATTATGRVLLIYGKNVIETAYKNRIVTLKNGKQVRTNAECVYGDTDSVFFKFNLKDLDGNKIVGKEALEITIELAKDAGKLATKYLKRPHDLEYEKTFLPFCLLSKKRYVGMLYEDDPNQGKIKFMGIVLKRRDNAAIVKDIYGGIIDMIIKEKSMEKAIQYCRECLQNMVEEKYPIEKLIVTKALRGYYKNPKQIAHNVLAGRIGDREMGNKPNPGDRIEYVYIQTENKKALQGEKIETPGFIKANNLKINYSFYITNQIMKPILQLFALGLEDMVGFKKRYSHTLKKWYQILFELQEKWMEEDKFIKKCEELKCKDKRFIYLFQFI